MNENRALNYLAEAVRAGAWKRAPCPPPCLYFIYPTRYHNHLSHTARFPAFLACSCVSCSLHDTVVLTGRNLFLPTPPPGVDSRLFAFPSRPSRCCALHLIFPGGGRGHARNAHQLLSRHLRGGGAAINQPESGQSVVRFWGLFAFADACLPSFSRTKPHQENIHYCCITPQRMSASCAVKIEIATDIGLFALSFRS